MNQLMAKPVTVLYLGSLTHSQDTNFLDRTRPHQDQIDFQSAVKLSLIRIPRSGKDIYSKHISITQTQPIKNFEIYYRNLEKTTGRYSLLVSMPELMVNQNDDILITPKQPIFTDLILFKGNFTKITLCIYGNLIRDDHFLTQKCPLFRANAPIEPMTQSLMQIKKDVFEQKREVIRQIQSETTGSDSIEEWHQVVNDDGINEQQIENICNLSQKLLTTYNNQQLTQEPFVVQFRAGLQDISSNLAKIFKNKHLGLYYPSFQDSTISNDLCLSITKLALYSLDLSLSEQLRGLEILKFALQLDRHTDFFIEHYGVEKLMKIFIDFFKINSVVLSTYKNLCLQVLISVSHWKKAALKMTQTVKNAFYHEIFQDTPPQPEKVSEDRERSREKKVPKRSRSQSASSKSDENNKKKKKDKQKKRNKSREKKKSKQSKEQISEKPEESKEQQNKMLTLREEIPNISFYEILLFYLEREKSCKQLTLVKILLEQILQTIKKNKIVSERVGLSTSLLKDLKYIFNPAGEVVNTKSLKQFASCYQPFLNSVQSQGVDCQIVAQCQKLRHMRHYSINPKLCKLLNRLTIQLASHQSQQSEDQTRTPYNSFFIVIMSELIRSRQRSVLYGFSRLLSSFRQGSSRDIIHLKRLQATMTMLSEYVYKVLLEDDGLFTVLHIDQIYSALINISNCLSKDQSAFTKELKRKIRQLTNYAMAYDLFTSSQGNFKTISQYFLRLFKFEHYQINKISDFKKKQFQRSAHPLSAHNITEVYCLGSFHELFPQQPLLQIDVYLKIFNIVLQYNKNAWSIFYENKLVSGFCVLFNRLSTLINFLVESSVERESALGNVKKLSQTVENYLNVMLRLLKVLTKRAEYQAAFNDLLDEDSFENVELYERAFSLYVSLFNAVKSNSSLLSDSCKKLTEAILAKILTIYDKLLESYELTTHQSRQSKVKKLWLLIYKTHFIDLKSRSACLSLYAFFVETLESNNMKLFNSLCLDENLKIQTNSSSEIKGHIPNNQKSIIQNLINANIYRNDPLIRVNLALLLKNLVDKNSDKYPITEKITSYFEAIFDETDSKLKEKGNTFESSKDLILLQKMVLLTDMLKRLSCTLTTKFDEKLLRQLKQLDSIKRDFNEEKKFQQKVDKLSLKIKTNIITFFKKSFSQKSQNPQFLALIQILAKNLDFSPKLFQSIQQRTLQVLSQAEMQIQTQSLNLINSSLEVICACSSNPFNQSMILYEVFLEKPYKPAPQLSLINLFSKLTSGEFMAFMSIDNNMILQNSQLSHSQSKLQILQKTLRQIAIRMVYFLCLLTSIDSKDFYSTESRRTAITCLVTEDKEFPMPRLQLLKQIIPIALIQTLKDYFAYPIVEKPLTFKTEEKKQSLKNKGYLFSKALFSIIMEGEPTAKSRYQYIGGPWKSGDLTTNFLYTPSKQRNYSKNVSKSLTAKQISTEPLYPFFSKSAASMTEKIQSELIQFTIKKRNKVVEKKASVDTQIKLTNVPLVLQNLAPKIDQNTIKRVSPSPSNKAGYGKSQIYDNKVRVSPSPPSNKLSGQHIIGFNALNQSSSQYTSQPSSNTGYATNIPPKNPTQTPNIPMPGMTPQGSMMPGSVTLPYESRAKNLPYENTQPVTTPVMERPVYPNTYYSTNPIQKSPSVQNQPPTVGTMPYIEMQKVNSQESNEQMRSGSNSAPRSNLPYNSGMGYQQPQQPFYGGNQPYTNPGHKMGSYDNRSYSPHHHNKPYSQNYGNQRQHHAGGYYSGSQDRNMGQAYGGYNNQMMGNNPRQGGYGSHSMSNRPQQNNGYNKYDYQSMNQPQNYAPTGMGGNYPQIAGMGQNYPPTTNYPPSVFNQSQQDQRQYNDAVLLVTELRGVLPEHLKNDKKNRLKQILVSNPRVEIRVKEYISTLK